MPFLPQDEFDQRRKEELQQLKTLESYIDVMSQDIQSFKLRIEMNGALNFNDRIRLRGVVAEFNLMYRNFFEPVIINKMDME